MKKFLFAALSAALILPLTASAGPLDLLKGLSSPTQRSELIRLEAPDKDQLVSLAVEEINSRDDSKEFGFYLFCDERLCWTTDIMYGDSGSISVGEVSRVYPENDTDLIVGFIHSHPPSDYNSLNLNHLFDELNKKPSVSDYQFALSIAADGLVFQPFTLWIIAPDNLLYTHELPRPTK